MESRLRGKTGEAGEQVRRPLHRRAGGEGGSSGRGEKRVHAVGIHTTCAPSARVRALVSAQSERET